MTRSDVTLGFSSTNRQERIKNILRQNSYMVDELNVLGMGLIRYLIASPPNLLLADFEFFGMSNLDALRIIVEDKICPIALVINESEKEIIGSSLELNENLYIIQRPVNKAVFINNLKFILKNIERISKLEKQVTDLNKILETRKQVDIAKAILMKSMNIDEERAHKYLQRESMEKRKPMKELVLDIINKKEYKILVKGQGRSK